MTESHFTEVKQSEYRIIFKSEPDGSMSINAEVIGEDNNVVTMIGDHFFKHIKDTVDNLLED